MVAIITDVHYRMSLALIRTLGEKGIRVVCCENETQAYPLGFYSKHCSERYRLPNEKTLDALYELCVAIFRRENEKPLLFPVGAKTLRCLSRTEELTRFRKVARFFIPSETQLDQFNDKTTVAGIAKREGVPVPAEYNPPYGDVMFPCIVKPACGERYGLPAAKRYQIVNSHQELQSARETFRNITGEEPIVQRYIEGEGAGCSVLCREGRVLSSICHKRVREYPVTGGPSTCCRAIFSEELEGYAKKMVAAVAYTGIAMVEFKFDREGRPYLLEINPRIWGTFPLVRVASSDFIHKWVALSAEYGNLEYKQHYKPRKMIYAFSDLIGAIGYARRGRLGKMFSAVIDFLNPFVADGLWEWSDIGPGLAYLKSVLKRR